ncbi:hypothetical protein BBP40_001443 [Aspergillus hancockii]|nr:hypothetical protein BBP40_001443 [Aspergillus hancockii]
MTCTVSSPHIYRELPTFDKVLNDAAPYPYSLNSFKAYLSQNHCSESLNFLEEVEQYTQTYRCAIQVDGAPLSSHSTSSPSLLLTWKRLISTYILPGSPQELNLSTEERNSLLKYDNARVPPPPCLINEAVKRIAQSLESSVFFQFLSSRVGLLCTPSPTYAKETVPNSEATVSNLQLSSTTKQTYDLGWRADTKMVLKRLLDLIGHTAKIVRSYRHLTGKVLPRMRNE